MFREWKRKGNVLAQKFHKEEFPGFLRKDIKVAEGISVVLEKNGILQNILDGGKTYSFGPINSDFTHALFVDASERKLEKKIRKIRTRDVQKLSLDVEIVFRVQDVDEFRENLMKSKEMLYEDDLWNEIYMELISGVIAPHLSGLGLLEVSRNGSLREKIGKEMEEKTGGILTGFGIEMVSFSVEWDFPKDIPKPSERGDDKVEESREEEFAKLEKERAEKEAEMQLEKEKTQRDMEDALEAMELKKIKQDMSEEEIKKKIGELSRAKEIAAEKHEKKQMSREAFRKIKDECNRNIVLLQGKLQGKEGYEKGNAKQEKPPEKKEPDKDKTAEKVLE